MEKDMIKCPTCKTRLMAKKKSKLSLFIVNKINNVVDTHCFRIVNFCKCPNCRRWIYHCERKEEERVK